MTLIEANYRENYKIKDIVAKDYDMEGFLFSLGCFPGEEIIVMSKLSNNYVIIVKGTRYSIDKNLAKCIEIIEN